MSPPARVIHAAFKNLRWSNVISLVWNVWEVGYATMADYRYIRIDASALSIAQTVAQISQGIPEALRGE